LQTTLFFEVGTMQRRHAKIVRHWITMLDAPCTVRVTLEQVVSNARRTVHDTFGEMKKAARKSGREAVLALEQHIEKHGCK
jgi:hypothetical protein